ncbi:hypothetical protein BBP40_012502 [Aspergillus hancockii]|nr:hypothetical protein BBP40_012502 [Aspergillus hancockii]
MPRSRAKDQDCLEVEANIPTTEQVPMITMMEPAAAVPATDLAASRKIAKNDTRASRAAVASSTQKDQGEQHAEPQGPIDYYYSEHQSLQQGNRGIGDLFR